MKKKIVNPGRFALFIIVCVLILAELVFICVWVINNHDKPIEPPICEHSYEKGVCTKCNEKDPNYDERSEWPNTKTSESAYPLSSVSPDYLVLVNKTHTVTNSYVPEDLTELSSDYLVAGVGSKKEKTNCLRKIAADALVEMIDAAKKDDIYIRLRTGYRSYSYQANLFNSYAKNHGETKANTYSAKAGQSEHHTGLAADLGGKSEGYELSDNFGETKEGIWVKEHCAEYGFILRYTDGTLDNPGEHTGYVYEAWHIRYVGVEAAKIIMEHNWTLEEYLNEISSFTSF